MVKKTKKAKKDASVEQALLALCGTEEACISDVIYKIHSDIGVIQSLIEINEFSLALQILDNNMAKDQDDLRRLLNDKL